MTDSKETEYEINIWTSDIRGAGTDAEVFIQIIGSEGDTGRIQLDNNSNNFEQGQEDKFTVQAKDVGSIEKVKVGHDGSKPMSGWHLNKILVKKKLKRPNSVSKSNSKKGDSVINDVNATDDYWFHVNRWFDTRGALERELFPTDETGNPFIRSPIETEYEINIWTTDIRGAGTDADVFIQIIGSEGDTGRMQLGNKSNNFEQGQEDEFTLHCKDVGKIEKVKIGHDGSNPMSGWHLNKILVKKKMKRPAKAVSKSNTKKGKPVIYDVNATDNYWFHVNRWFDTSEDDGVIERELFPNDEAGNPLGRASSEEVSNKPDILNPSRSRSQRSNHTDNNDESNKPDSSNHSRPKSERSNNTDNNDRSNNPNDPFYVASVYDREPKDELKTLHYHPQPDKPHFSSASFYDEQGSQHNIATETLPKTSMSDRRTRMTNPPKEYSPIEEEATQPMLEIHTEDQDYFTNDFQEPNDASRGSPSGMSMYFKEETTKGVVGSIRRTLNLFN